MHKLFRKKKIPCNASMMKAIKKAEADLDRECERQTELIYAAGTLALHREFKWNQDQICQFFHEHEKVYDECSETTQKSMIQMCSEEVGIDMAIEQSDTPWDEIIFLNPEYDNTVMTAQQFLYMRVQQKKWVRAQILACFMLAAKRNYDYDEDNLARLFSSIIEILREYEGDISDLKKQCKSEVGFVLVDDPLTVSHEKRKGVKHE